MANLLEERLGNKNGSYSPNEDDDKKKRKKKQKTVKLSAVTPVEFDEDEFIREEEEKDYAHTRSLRKKKVISAAQQKIIKTILVILIFYVVFLIYGLYITEYVYDEKGNVVPEVLSVQEIEEYHEYDTLKAYYLVIRDLYEKIIVLDYRLGLGTEDFNLLASEYETLLNDVSTIVVQLQAYTPPTKYNQAYNMLMQLAQTDIAVYIQNISGAITQNDSDKASKAIINKETIYNNFVRATEIMVSLSDGIKKVDVSDIKNWSADKVRAEKIGAISGEVTA